MIERLRRILDRRLGRSRGSVTAASAPPVVQFVMIAEAGPLEVQARLLCASIRRNAGRYRQAPILVVSPRPDRRPSAATRLNLQALGAELLEIDVASVAPEYGTSFRVHSAALVERESHADVLVVMDSDIVVLGEPDLDLGSHAAAARPVDVKGMCTSGPTDPNDAYWRDLCRVCGVRYDDLPMVVTTVDRARIKACYNGGFVVVRRTAGVLAATDDLFRRSVAADLRPHRGTGLELKTGHGFVQGRGAEYWGSSQACLSLAVWGAGLSVRVLPASHNVPVHIPAHLAAGPTPEPIVAAHYHQAFDGALSENPLFGGRVNVPPEVLGWLRTQLPLSKRSGPDEAAAGTGACDRGDSAETRAGGL